MPWLRHAGERPHPGRRDFSAGVPGHAQETGRLTLPEMASEGKHDGPACPLEHTGVETMDFVSTRTKRGVVRGYFAEG